MLLRTPRNSPPPPPSPPVPIEFRCRPPLSKVQPVFGTACRRQSKELQQKSRELDNLRTECEGLKKSRTQQVWPHVSGSDPPPPPPPQWPSNRPVHTSTQTQTNLSHRGPRGLQPQRTVAWGGGGAAGPGPWTCPSAPPPPLPRDPGKLVPQDRRRWPRTPTRRGDAKGDGNVFFGGGSTALLPPRRTRGGRVISWGTLRLWEGWRTLP